ncbi:MAG: Cys-rich protein [Spirochaetales bacterium]|nr:Cys-rich protein [Spirochaetales bacterium]
MKHWKVTILFVAAVLAAPVYLSAKDCKSACDKFVSCTVAQHKRQPTAEENKKLLGGCMQSCARHTQAVLACYAKSANSCGAYWSCISAAYKK